MRLVRRDVGPAIGRDPLQGVQLKDSQLRLLVEGLDRRRRRCDMPERLARILAGRGVEVDDVAAFLDPTFPVPGVSAQTRPRVPAVVPTGCLVTAIPTAT